MSDSKNETFEDKPYNTSVDDLLDEQDLVSIQKSQVEIDRGEFVDAKEFHAEIRRKSAK